MTDQNAYETTPPGDDPFAGGASDTGSTGNGSTETSAKGREWLSQLEAMINDVANQAAPVARQVAAKAAELTAVAAVKAGPLAHRAAEVTTDAGQKLAERAQSLAAELRATDSGTSSGTGAADATADMGGSDATFEDATDSTTDGAPTTSFEGSTGGDEDAGPQAPSF